MAAHILTRPAGTLELRFVASRDSAVQDHPPATGRVTGPDTPHANAPTDRHGQSRRRVSYHARKGSEDPDCLREGSARRWAARSSEGGPCYSCRGTTEGPALGTAMPRRGLDVQQGSTTSCALLPTTSGQRAPSLQRVRSGTVSTRRWLARQPYGVGQRLSRKSAATGRWCTGFRKSSYQTPNHGPALNAAPWFVAFYCMATSGSVSATPAGRA